MAILSVLTGILGPIKDVIDDFHTSGEEKEIAKQKMELILQQRDAEIEKTYRAELDTQKSIIIAEMAQGDLYTKRARPTLVYAGLGILLVNHVLLPWAAHFLGQSIPMITLPDIFWISWGTTVSVWSVGRSAERRGMNNTFIKLVTGNK